MQIWVDADACPNPIKEILFRAALRVKVNLTLVANRPIRIPPSLYIKAVTVGSGFDVADNWIAQQVSSGDLVITADIPLAAAVIERKGFALNPRGEFYSKENISERLTMRNFMEELRSSGVDIGGPATLSQADRQAFANQLDRFINMNTTRSNP
jgi:uncharacterized protein YaiI (UPF0178 family)